MNNLLGIFGNKKNPECETIMTKAKQEYDKCSSQPYTDPNSSKSYLPSFNFGFGFGKKEEPKTETQENKLIRGGRKSKRSKKSKRTKKSKKSKTQRRH